MWRLPAVGSVNQYGDTFEGKNYQIGELSTSDPDCVWDLSYHRFADLLLQISAKNMIHVWTNPTSDQKPVSKEFQLDGSPSSQQVTCGCWLETQQNHFLAGYNDGTIAVFDYIQGKSTSSHKLSAPVLKVIAHSLTTLVACALENGEVVIFDYNTNK